MPAQSTSLFPRLLPLATLLLGTYSGTVCAEDNTNTLSGTLRTWPPDPSQYSLPVDDTYYAVPLGEAASAPAHTATPAPVSTPVSHASGSGTYKVQRGETLYAVMRATGVPVKSIIAVNGLKAPFHLRAGQVLKLSGASSATLSPAITAEPYVQGDGGSHVVRAGETLYEVMRQTGVHVKKIISLNNLTAPYSIKVGQTLRLY